MANFNTFKQDDGTEEVVHGVHIEMDEDTGNYFVTLIGKELGGFYDIDFEEFLNFAEVINYLQRLGR